MIAVINLEHREDRRKQFITNWSASGHTEDVTFFTAVLGTSLPVGELGFKCNARSAKAIAGRLGCYLSHTRTLRAALDENRFPLLILEDDIKPTNGVDIASVFASAPDANLLYFGALPRKNKKVVKFEGQPGWNPLGTETLYGGHAIGFPTATAAKELLDFLERNPTTYDSALIRYQKQFSHRVAVYHPFLFEQTPSFSDIDNTVVHKK